MKHGECSQEYCVKDVQFQTSAPRQLMETPKHCSKVTHLANHVVVHDNTNIDVRVKIRGGLGNPLLKMTMTIWNHCEPIGRRAREAAARGDATFAVPEAVAAVDWVAATAHDPSIRDEATVWQSSGAGYHALVRLCARTVVGLDARFPPSTPTYLEKAAGELEPMLALWPDVLVLPTALPLTPWSLIELRAFPVHPLGLVDTPAWTDGAMAPPSEFFFHDLDHARFKVREDLRILDINIPDAYRDGATRDPATGQHRVILTAARGRIGERLWVRCSARTALARRLRQATERLGNGPLQTAAALLLFEILHEKSFPLEADVLDRELSSEAHIAKLRAKVISRFFPDGTDDAVVAALGPARVALREALS